MQSTDIHLSWPIERWTCGLAWPPRRRARDATRPRAPDAVTDSRAVTRSRVGGFGWRRVAVRIAVEASRGLVRIAEVDAEEPPPLSTILKKYKGGDGIKMRKEAIRSSSTTKAKRGRPKAKEDDGARVVRAELEDHEEAARYQKDGGKVLGEKWVGLCVRDDEYQFTGEIVGMKWVGDTEPPQICAEIRSYDKKVTQTYCVYDLPAMVIAAEDEQLLDVLLEYDPPEDEFDLPGDEEAERTMAQPVEPEDDDDAEDDDVDLEL